MTKAEIKAKDEEWKAEIKKRDKVCQICGNTKILQAHHCIIAKADCNKERRELRWDVNNGILLCSRHHIFDIHRKASYEIMNDFLNLLVKKFGQMNIAKMLLKKSWVDRQ